MVRILMLMLASLPLSCSVQMNPNPSFRKNVYQNDESDKEHLKNVTRYYKKLNLPCLSDIPKNEYDDYTKYVSDHTAYVIVHPAYYLFFHDNNRNKVVMDRKDDFSKNIVDLFIDSYPVDKDSKLQQMKVALKNETRFLREKALRNNLVILVIPPIYWLHPSYPYKRYDEFARYLNEVTNGSPSFIYVESENFNTGYLSSSMLSRLDRFFSATGVTKVKIGGEYLKKCVNNFYEQARQIENIKNAALIPEICAISPDALEDN